MKLENYTTEQEKINMADINMNEKEFCYWLQGYVEINGSVPSEKEWQIIKDHLQLVFNKVTPDRFPAYQMPPILGNPPVITC